MPDDEHHLAHLMRGPSSEPPVWTLARTHVSPEHGSRQPGRMLLHSKALSHRLTNREVYAALSPAEVRWSFRTDEGWRLAASGVCEDNWREAIGEAPTRTFEP